MMRDWKNSNNNECRLGTERDRTRERKIYQVWLEVKVGERRGEFRHKKKEKRGEDRRLSPQDILKRRGRQREEKREKETGGVKMQVLLFFFFPFF